MNLYEFRQNNSEGTFDIDNKLGHYTFIEAKNEEIAIDKGKEMGIYFDGVDAGIDCECCGDRWHEPSKVNVTYWTKASIQRSIEHSKCLRVENPFRIHLANGKIISDNDEVINYFDSLNKGVQNGQTT